MNIDLESIQKLLDAEDYNSAIALLEVRMRDDRDNATIYWMLGLAYLLNEQEDSAQACWTEGILEQFTDFTEGVKALTEFLKEQAIRLTRKNQLQSALAIWEQVLMLDVSDLTAHLHWIYFADQLQQFSLEHLAELGTVERLQLQQGSIDEHLLLEDVQRILQYPTALSLDFLQASIPYFQEIDWLNPLMNLANHLAYDRKLFSYAINIAKMLLEPDPGNFFVLNDLLKYYRLKEDHQSIVVTANQLWRSIEVQTIDLALKGYFLSHLLSVFLNENDWSVVEAISQQLTLVLEKMLRLDKVVVNRFLSGRFWALTCPLLYLIDNPQRIRRYLNRNAQIFQEDIQLQSIKTSGILFKQSCPEKVLLQPLQRIGYIAHTLRKHSVGWLCRWLFKYHHSQSLQIYVYLIGQEADDLTEEWIYPHVYRYYHFHRDVAEIVEQISQDKIQILVDLDVLTHNVTAQVLAHKSAPVQVSWLGSDASGLPAIDYFLVDPYVVPQDAQRYYREKLWCLPQTYLALDGFEVGTPTLSREHLRFGEQTVVFLCVQNKIKANPAILRLQLRIIQAVPNSLFWIKGGGDNELIRGMVEQLAQEMGLDITRVVFLPKDKDEMTHRANLGLADVALDTYPYNGATTTLETLWMGVPLVTRVGEQFAARNSYSFLRQVGVQEGIAWTDEEYVDWGIRFGLDADLRQQVKERLWSARQDSPLWQGEQFTREMEKAYGEMWDIYQGRSV